MEGFLGKGRVVHGDPVRPLRKLNGHDDLSPKYVEREWIEKPSQDRSRGFLYNPPSFVITYLSAS